MCLAGCFQSFYVSLTSYLRILLAQHYTHSTKTLIHNRPKNGAKVAPL